MLLQRSEGLEVKTTRRHVLLLLHVNDCWLIIIYLNEIVVLDTCSRTIAFRGRVTLRLAFRWILSRQCNLGCIANHVHHGSWDDSELTPCLVSSPPPPTGLFRLFSSPVFPNYYLGLMAFKHLREGRNVPHCGYIYIFTWVLIWFVCSTFFFFF